MTTVKVFFSFNSETLTTKERIKKIISTQSRIRKTTTTKIIKES
jgi:hypothetical protein